MHVRDNGRDALCRRRATDALAQRDAHAGGPALKWPEHEFAVFLKVEAGPVQIGKRMKDQRREVRRVGDQIALAGEQAGKLRRELIVELVEDLF